MFKLYRWLYIYCWDNLRDGMGDEGGKVEPKYMWKILNGVEWKTPRAL